MSDMDVGVVDVRIFWVPPARSHSGTEQKDGLIVVHRVMACGPRGASRQQLPIPQSSDGATSEDDSAAERLMHAFDDYAAKNLVGPAWKKSSEFWVTPVCEDVAAVAEKLSGFHDQWHDLVLGQPVQYLTGSTPLSDIAMELPLPGDLLFTGIKRLVQITGIFVGLASGQPLLVNACLKSLVHDVVGEVISETIEAFLSNSMELAGAFERDLVTDLTKEERDYIAGLQGPLEIARDDQQESEKARHDEPSWPDQDDVTINIQPHQDMTSNIAGGKFNSSESQTIAPPSKQHDKSQERG